MSTWIDESITIDFPVPASLQALIARLEEMNQSEDYAYFNYSEALDCAAKELVVKGKLTTAQWEILCSKYDG